MPQTPCGDLAIGRVVTYAHETYTVQLQDGSELAAELSGRLRYSGDLWPTVGDWVEIRGGLALDRVLPRKNAISRKDPGERIEQQVLAANVDVIFVVSALDRDFNLRRIERYLVLAGESGARVVLVLNKADLAASVPEALAQLTPVTRGVPVVVMTALNGADAISQHVAPAETAVLLGSSGVGKSTIANALLGGTVQQTRATGAGTARGRHTTTQRQLLATPDGWFLIDTPGLREIQLWAAPESVDAVFDDITTLAATCQFRDCTHGDEPGCAISEAAEAGRLDAGRLESFFKLRREAAFLERKADPIARSEYQRYIKKIMRSARERTKAKR